jgi:hypothetical protein
MVDLKQVQEFTQPGDQQGLPVRGLDENYLFLGQSDVLRFDHEIRKGPSRLSEEIRQVLTPDNHSQIGGMSNQAVGFWGSNHAYIIKEFFRLSSKFFPLLLPCNLRFLELKLYNNKIRGFNRRPIPSAFGHRPLGRGREYFCRYKVPIAHD